MASSRSLESLPVLEMEKIKDEVHRKQFLEGIEKIIDLRNATGTDSPSATVQALVTDFDHPCVKRMKNIESFTNRFEKLARDICSLLIETDDYTLIKVMEEDSSGRAQLVCHKSAKKIYAMKVLRKFKMDEGNVMAYANSEWIMQLHFPLQDSKYLYMVVDYMPGKDLLNLMSNHVVPKKWPTFYHAEVLSYRGSIHSMNFVHKDVTLKPDGMLLDKCGHLKLADFGTCIRMDADGLVRTYMAVGTPDCISLEVLESRDEALAGNRLPFVGFTYSRDYQLFSTKGGNKSSGGDVVDLVVFRTHSNPKNQMESDLEKEKKTVEELQLKVQSATSQMEWMKSREIEITEVTNQLQNSITAIKRSLKEAQRRADNEADSRRKTEALLTEAKKKWGDKQNKRTREMNNNQQTNDKMNQLEKHVNGLQEKLKTDNEKATKQRKLIGELTEVKETSKQLQSELQRMLTSLQTQRNVLQTEVATLQSQISQEKSSRNQASDLSQESENELPGLLVELDGNKERRAKLSEDDRFLVERASLLEKEVTGITLESKTARSSSSSVAFTKALQETGGTNLESIKELQAKLHEEKSPRRKADLHSQDKERQMSILSVDHHQIRQRLKKCEGVHRQESVKVRALQANLKQEKQKKNAIQKELYLSQSEVRGLKEWGAQLTNEVSNLRLSLKSVRDKLHKVKAERSAAHLRMKMLQDKLETEERLHKMRAAELEEKQRNLQELEEERSFLTHQLQLAFVRADSEAQARSVAEGTVAELEKEKAAKELELRGVLLKREADQANKEKSVNILKKRETVLKKALEQISEEREDLSRQLRYGEEDVEKRTKQDKEIERLNGLLNQQISLKEQAVKKLTEILLKKDTNLRDKSKIKVSSADLKRKKKDYGKLQQELIQEREKYNQMEAMFRKKIRELKAQVVVESQMRMRLEMQVDSEIGQLQSKIALFNSETASLSSGDAEDETEDGDGQESRLEGWLSVRNKQNMKGHEWRKQYVVVSSRKIKFYKSEHNKQNTEPVLVLHLNKVFHVRPVTEDDVTDGDAKDISRIFQVLHAGEAVKPVFTVVKGHEFDQRSYHVPTACEICPRPLWHMFRPPPALECRRCRFKIHEEHAVKRKDAIAPSRVHLDVTSLKDLLLLAHDSEDQKVWVGRLRRRVRKCRYKLNKIVDGSMVSQRESTSSTMKPSTNKQTRNLQLCLPIRRPTENDKANKGNIESKCGSFQQKLSIKCPYSERFCLFEKSCFG